MEETVGMNAGNNRQDRSMVIQNGLLTMALLNPPLSRQLGALVPLFPACANDNRGEIF